MTPQAGASNWTVRSPPAPPARSSERGSSEPALPAWPRTAATTSWRSPSSPDCDRALKLSLSRRRSHGRSLARTSAATNPTLTSTSTQHIALDASGVADASPARAKTHARRCARKNAIGDTSAGPRRAGQASATLAGVAPAPYENACEEAACGRRGNQSRSDAAAPAAIPPPHERGQSRLLRRARGRLRPSVRPASLITNRLRRR